MAEQTRITSCESAGQWVRLARAPWWTPVFYVSPILIVLVISDVTIVGGLWRHTLPFVARLAIGVAVAGAAVGIVIVVSWLRRRPVEVNLSQGLMRSGRRTTTFDELTEARLGVSTSRIRRIVALTLRTASGVRASVMLRGPGGRVISPRDAAVLTEVIERSNVRMPTSRDDPNGAFARYNFPDNVTKETALALIEHPPDLGDPLPVPPRA